MRSEKMKIIRRIAVPLSYAFLDRYFGYRKFSIRLNENSKSIFPKSKFNAIILNNLILF